MHHLFMKPPRTFLLFFFFFNDTATTEIYTLSLHDALPISPRPPLIIEFPTYLHKCDIESENARFLAYCESDSIRSEEHTSELQSRQYLVCRLLLEKKTIRNFTTSDAQEDQQAALIASDILA